MAATTRGGLLGAPMFGSRGGANVDEASVAAARSLVYQLTAGGLTQSSVVCVEERVVQKEEETEGRRKPRDTTRSSRSCWGSSPPPPLPLRRSRKKWRTQSVSVAILVALFTAASCALLYSSSVSSPAGRRPHMHIVGRRVQGGWSRFSVLSSNSSSSLSLLFPFNSSSSSSLSDSPVPPPPPPRVFCFILTHNKSLASRAKAVALTWAPSCDKAIFISDQFTASTPHNHPLQPFEVFELGRKGRKWLWAKTRQSILFIGENYDLDEYDWFLKADDDTYVIMENLRLFLSSYNASVPHYFGKTFRKYVHKGYNSGGAGYVLSRQSMRLVTPVLRGDSDSTQTQTHSNRCSRLFIGPEDLLLGRCLAEAGVFPDKTVDVRGRELFHALAPGREFEPLLHMNWYHRYSLHRHFQGERCCSEYSATFHYVRETHMLLLHFALYNLKVSSSSSTPHDQQTPESP